jgi:hypothetical protein
MMDSPARIGAPSSQPCCHPSLGKDHRVISDLDDSLNGLDLHSTMLMHEVVCAYLWLAYNGLNPHSTIWMREMVFCAYLLLS